MRCALLLREPRGGHAGLLKGGAGRLGLLSIARELPAYERHAHQVSALATARGRFPGPCRGTGRPSSTSELCPQLLRNEGISCPFHQLRDVNSERPAAFYPQSCLPRGGSGGQLTSTDVTPQASQCSTPSVSLPPEDGDSQFFSLGRLDLCVRPALIRLGHAFLIFIRAASRASSEARYICRRRADRSTDLSPSQTRSTHCKSNIPVKLGSQSPLDRYRHQLY